MRVLERPLGGNYRVVISNNGRMCAVVGSCRFEDLEGSEEHGYCTLRRPRFKRAAIGKAFEHAESWIDFHRACHDANCVVPFCRSAGLILQIYFALFTKDT